MNIPAIIPVTMFVTVIAEEDEKKDLSFCNCKFKAVFPQHLVLAESFWLRKITTDPHIIAQAHTMCPDDTIAKIRTLYLRNDIVSYRYVPVA